MISNTLKGFRIYLLLVGVMALIGCGGGGGGGSTPTPTPTPTPIPTPTPTGTDIDLSVILPEGTVVVQNNRFNPLDWMMNGAIAADIAVTGLTEGNFEARLYDADGLDFTIVDITTVVDNGDGTYTLTVDSDPSVSLILVSLVQVDGVDLELQIPATSDGSDGALEMSYASTAATNQYLDSVADAGGFSDELSVAEVEALIETVTVQISSTVFPDGVDPSDPRDVIAALEIAAEELVENEIEIVIQPPPAPGVFDAFAGNYHAGIFSRYVFGDTAGTMNEAGLEYQDFTFIDGQATLPGIVIEINETNSTAALNFGDSYFSGDNMRAQVGVPGRTISYEEGPEEGGEILTAPILPDGTIIVNPGAGALENGWIFDDGVDRFYYTEINNSQNFRLLPWGEAYVGSSLLQFDEFLLDNCLSDLGLLASEVEILTDIEAFEELLSTTEAAQAGFTGIIANECERSALLHEMLEVTLAKKGVGMTTANLEGAWGIVGMGLGADGLSSFSTELLIDDLGNISDTGYRGAVVTRGTVEGFTSLRIDVDVNNSTGGTASLAGNGILTLDFSADIEEEEIFNGYVSADQGLMYFGGFEGCSDCSESGGVEVRAQLAFGVPLASGVTAESLNGQQFEIVGLERSSEGTLTDATGLLSINADSFAGLNLAFSLDGENLEATVSGSTDWVGTDITWASGVRAAINVAVELNRPADGVFPVSVADNGALTVELPGSEGEEDILLTGFLDANGRLALALMSSAGLLDAFATAEASEEGVGAATELDFVNIGYLLGVPVQ